MIEVVENKSIGVIWCRVVYMYTKWAISNWNVFEFIDKLQTAVCQLVQCLQQCSPPAGMFDQDLYHPLQGLPVS